MSAESKTMSEHVKRLLSQWHIASPTKQILEHAQECEALAGMDLVEAALQKRIVSENEAKSKTGIKTLLGQKSTDSQQDKYTQLQCLTKGILYLTEQTSELSINPAMRQSKAIDRELRQYQAIPMSSMQANFLVFADYDGYRRFTTMGKAEQLQSALSKVVRREGHWVYAIATRRLYLSITNSTEYEDATGSGIDDDSGHVLLSIHKGISEQHAQLIKMIEFAHEAGANDIAIYPDGDRVRVFFRIHKRLIEQPSMSMDFDRYQAVTLLTRMISGATMDSSRVRDPEGGQITYASTSAEIFIRCSFIPLDAKGSDKEYVSIDLRLLPRQQKAISLHNLGIDERAKAQIRNASIAKSGLVIVSGPTNSGKSTTLAGMLEENRQHYGANLKRISIEDPVERELPGVLHVKVPRHLEDTEAGRDPWTMVFKEVLRHDPDVINMAEVRDAESGNLCVQAAASGHLTFTTTHANDVLASYRRLRNLVNRDMWPMLIESLLSLVSQRTLSRVCSHCSSEEDVSRDDRAAYEYYKHSVGLNDLELPSKIRVANKQGCPHCQGGYTGLVAVNEVLNLTPAVKQKIDSNKVMMPDLYEDCAIVMQRQANELLHKGVITFEDAMI